MLSVLLENAHALLSKQSLNVDKNNQGICKKFSQTFVKMLIKFGEITIDNVQLNIITTIMYIHRIHS